MKKRLYIMLLAFVLCGCGGSNEDVAIEAEVTETQVQEASEVPEVPQVGTGSETKREIIYVEEHEKVEGMEVVDDETIATLEKVPDASVTYVPVDGYGNPVGMGVQFQGYCVGVRANPIDGYQYVRCESETIEFYEYVYSEGLGYDVPWFYVPEEGNHIIYVYYEPIQ